MTEQDKPTLVPAVLNDLMDVDGEPAEGDSLTRIGGVWTAGKGDRFPNGPLVQSWSVTATPPAQTTLGQINYIESAPSLANDGLYYQGNEAIFEEDPDAWGSWADVGSGQYAFTLNAPGVYSYSMGVQATLSAPASAGTSLTLTVGHYWMPYVERATTPGWAWTGASLGANAMCFPTELTQAMLDQRTEYEAGYDDFVGFHPRATYAGVSGAQTITSLSWSAIIYNWSAGPHDDTRQWLYGI